MSCYEPKKERRAERLPPRHEFGNTEDFDEFHRVTGNHSRIRLLLEALYVATIGGLLVLFPEMDTLWCYVAGQLAGASSFAFFAFSPKTKHVYSLKLIAYKYVISSAVALTFIGFFTADGNDKLLIFVVSYFVARPLRHIGFIERRKTGIVPKHVD